MTVTAPGNILLLGEYAVLEEGGLGLAAAVGGRVRLEARPARSLSIEGSWTGGSFRWTRRHRGESALASAVFDAAVAWRLAHGRGTGFPKLRIRIDSSELYSRGGRKTGLGSSAAVTLALAYALRPDSRVDHALPRLALEAHRAVQGGTGSGYDVYCSYFGGWGVFCGGAHPSLSSFKRRFDMRMYLFPGAIPVSTGDAIRAYFRWKARDPDRAGRFVLQSNRTVKAFLAARSGRVAAAAFRDARATGITLGDAIGVEARIRAPAGVDPELCKSVGAGNELGVYLRLPGAPEPPGGSGLTPLDVTYGFEWHRRDRRRIRS